MKSNIIMIIFAIIIIVGIILIPALIYTAGKIYFTRERIYEGTWEINIPSNFKESYHYTSPRGFQGDGIRYTIFVATEMNSNISLIMNSTNRAKEIETRTGHSKDGRSKDIERFVQAIITELAVPEKNKPPFDVFYMWQERIKHGSDILVILYFPHTNRVYFAEELI